ncbi:MAG: flavin reductase family protein [Candidatus Burarchaeum sp.]|nr:flavin reductase family protein [Candidatus Burarchaeum sp.]MDO8339304.1 flavin reductase family protein [Candidatus Burarchaeum sp.]
MDLAWDDARTRKFTSTLGLITSDGPWGPNIMCAEWSRHISYTPSIMQLNINPAHATADNILKSKEFGLNLAADTQASLCSAAGNNTGKEVDKISLLKELGGEFYTGKKINAPMLKGVAMNAECKLIKHENFGDHFAFIGEVLEISAEPTLSALLYHEGKYFKLGEQLPRPPQEVMDKTKVLAEKYKKTQ